jgi:hypothetical protein
MKYVKVIWTVAHNLIVLGIILKIYDVVSGSFETIVASGLILIYQHVIWGSTMVARATVDANLALHTQFYELKKLLGKDDEDLQEEIRQARELYQSKSVQFYTNIGFAVIFLAIALLNIIRSL